MPVALPSRAARGFTLIEILVVMVIIAIVASLAMVSIGLLGEDREIERESERLTDAIALLQEQAELEGRPILLKQEANPDNRVPQLVAWGSGETTPYRLSLVRRGGARLALVGNLDGSIQVERGDEKP